MTNVVYHPPNKKKYYGKQYQFWGRGVHKKGTDNWIKNQLKSGRNVIIGKDEIGVFLYKSTKTYKKPKTHILRSARKTYKSKDFDKVFNIPKNIGFPDREKDAPRTVKSSKIKKKRWQPEYMYENLTPLEYEILIRSMQHGRSVSIKQIKSDMKTVKRIKNVTDSQIKKALKSLEENSYIRQKYGKSKTNKKPYKIYEPRKDIYVKEKPVVRKPTKKKK